MSKQNKQQASRKGCGFGQNRHELTEWNESPDAKARIITICKAMVIVAKEGLLDESQLPLFNPERNKKHKGFVRVYQCRGVGVAFNEETQLYTNYRY